MFLSKGQMVKNHSGGRNLFKIIVYQDLAIFVALVKLGCGCEGL